MAIQVTSGSHEAIAKSIAAALGGMLIGWSSSALTMGGRVEALERGQQRIESMLTTLLMDRGKQPAPLPPIARKKGP